MIIQINKRKDGEDLIGVIKELGYDYVTLDLEGFRSGSQDIKLEEK